jgi:uncharacterized protein YegL
LGKVNKNLFDAGYGEKRCPIVLLADTSKWMEGDSITVLNSKLRQFQQDVQKDVLASQIVDFAVVSFRRQIRVEQDFCLAGEFSAPPLMADGDALLGAAVMRALEMLESRKKFYKESGIAYFRPRVFLITAGFPDDETSRAVAKVRRMEAEKKVQFFAVGVEGADMDFLAQLSVRPPMKLIGLRFAEMFQWLGDPLRAGSQGEPGQDQRLLPSPLGWGNISE